MRRVIAVAIPKHDVTCAEGVYMCGGRGGEGDKVNQLG